MNFLSKKAAWSIWTCLFAAYTYMAVFVMGGASETITKLADDPNCATPLDLHLFGASMNEAQLTLTCFGPKGREFYVTIAAREDILYPVSYGLFYSFTLFALSSFCIRKRGVTIGLAMIPLVVVICDFTENYYILSLLREFPQLSANSVCAMSLFNSLKWGLFFPVPLLILIFSIWSLRILYAQKKSVD